VGLANKVFSGQQLDGDALLLRYTYSGDANLDGTVNALDFNSLATNFGLSGKYWTDGDFNYDGTVNASDFIFLSENFNLTLATPSSMLATLVPEPGVALSVIGVITLSSRRRVSRERSMR